MAASSAAAVRTARIAVVSIPACPYCNRAKEALRTSGYEFANIDVSENEQLRQRVRELTNQRTVPQVRFCRGRAGAFMRRSSISEDGQGSHCVGMQWLVTVASLGFVAGVVGEGLALASGA